MRRLGAISTLTFVGALSAVLAGCPIWGGDGGGPTPIDGGSEDVVQARDVVTVDATDAGNDAAPVDTGVDVPVDTGPAHCTSTAQCAQGEYCTANGVCAPGCGADADCAYLSSELVCDTNTHQCVRGGGCTDNSQCAANQYCVDGACRDATDVCTFDYQCGGRTCVNGRCVDQCSTLADGGVQGCAAGQICVAGYCQNPTTGTCNCAADEVCTNGLCSKPCSADTECGTGNFCDHGVCRVDDRRPAPFCTPDAGCAPSSVCIDGVCRLKCPSPNPGETADQACQRVAVNFTTCDQNAAPPICKDPNELAPQCSPSQPCASGLSCVNGACH